MSSCLYAGVVTHARSRPRRHSLRYSLVQGLFDLDELPAVAKRLKVFGFDRGALVSFHQKDHGDGSGELRAWVEAQLAAAGLEGPWGALRVLCMPRVLGYVFNPLSVYFCHRPDGALSALLYEVNNTFGERHAYVLPVAGGAWPVRQSCAKSFYVSPFLPMGLTYAFRIAAPAETVAVEVCAQDQDGPILEARFCGERRALTDRALLALLAAHPGMTLKVILGIHWEAAKLWLGGLRLIPRPAAPAR